MARRILIILAAAASLLAPARPAAAQAQSGESVRGNITNPVDGVDEPVPGVVITVETAGGERVGSAETDENGDWEIPVPGPGDYEVSLDEDSLPEDVTLTDRDRRVQTVTVNPAQGKIVLFFLGEDTSPAKDSTVRRVAQLSFEGLKFGLIIAMAAIGLSLIFGTTGLTNFAHGEQVTLGALLTWWFNWKAGLNLIPATALAMVVGAGAGIAFDRTVWRPLRRRGSSLISQLVVSIGLAIAFRYVFLYLFGGGTRPYKQYALQTGFKVGPVSMTPKDVVIVLVSLAVLGGVGLALQRTRLGKAMRAVADNRDLAASTGIDVQRVIQYVWAFGSALAVLGGVLYGVGQQIDWKMGNDLLLLMFAGITLGGLGTAYGALLGSLVVGVLVQVSTLFIATELKNVGAFVLLAVILVVRPQGLLGRAERIG
ncbi:MAG: branched-chain amino acid ABC transporter permease [Acidimicrobiales bacterium]